MKRLGSNLLLVAAVAICVIAIVVTSYSGTSDRERIDQVAAEAHDALCAFKADLQGRAANTQKIVDDMKTGRRELIPGLTIADLERSLNAQKSTLESLTSLDCSKGAQA